MESNESVLLEHYVEEVAQLLAEIKLKDDALWYYEHIADIIIELQSEPSNPEPQVRGFNKFKAIFDRHKRS